MEKKISEIRKLLKEWPDDRLSGFIEEYGNDERSGVRELVKNAESRALKYEEELLRTERMSEYEKQYSSYTYICGIDEVGRGPLAGPVVAGAVILDPGKKILYLNDSKKLSAKKREELYGIIMEEALAVGLGFVDNSVIDQINILQATYKAMREAVKNLGIKPDILLNDAVTIPEVSIKQVPIIKGDAKSISIAAASIVAKVTRDRLMVEYSETYPEYNFAGNKGYGSDEHIKALRKYGPCPLHRKSFIGGIIGQVP
ncbi:MAG: ribonuclease HII [Lachnospiraceae bacterium]|nr:ribonuclease HII [Lachnospiraceae bacterium]